MKDFLVNRYVRTRTTLWYGPLRSPVLWVLARRPGESLNLSFFTHEVADAELAVYIRSDRTMTDAHISVILKRRRGSNFDSLRKRGPRSCASSCCGKQLRMVFSLELHKCRTHVRAYRWRKLLEPPSDVTLITKHHSELLTTAR